MLCLIVLAKRRRTFRIHVAKKYGSLIELSSEQCRDEQNRTKSSNVKGASYGLRKRMFVRGWKMFWVNFGSFDNNFLTRETIDLANQINQKLKYDIAFTDEIG